MTSPDIEQIARQIGVPSDRWYGNCHGIASAIVRTDALRSFGGRDTIYRLVRGHWIGSISIRSYYGYRRNVLFAAHSWIEAQGLVVPRDPPSLVTWPHPKAPSSTMPIVRNPIIDPTRFAFDGKKPYIYVGPNDGSYDAGGNVWRTLNEPTLLPYDPTMTVIPLDLPAETERFISVLLEEYPVGSTYPVKTSAMYTYALCMWLANLAIDRLGDHAEPIYRALVQVGHAAMLPMDNRDIVLGDIYRKRTR